MSPAFCRRQREGITSNFELLENITASEPSAGLIGGNMPPIDCPTLLPFTRQVFPAFRTECHYGQHFFEHGNLMFGFIICCSILALYQDNFNTYGHRFKHRFCLFFMAWASQKPVMIMFIIIHLHSSVGVIICYDNKIGIMQAIIKNIISICVQHFY